MFIVDRSEDPERYNKDDRDHEWGQLKVIFQTISKNNGAGVKIKQELDSQGESQTSHSQVTDQDYVVDLVATDGDKAYTTVVKSKLLNYLMAEQGGDAEEWKRVATSILFGTPLSGTKPVVCTYSKSSDDNVLTLNVRQGHAPRPGAEALIPIIGSFTLAYRPNSTKKAVTTPFQMLVMSASKLGPSLAEARMIRQQFDTLQNQMTQFLQEKTELENSLFEKFAMLLNKKKAKLRALRAGIDVADSEDEDIYGGNGFPSSAAPAGFSASASISASPPPLKRQRSDHESDVAIDISDDENDENIYSDTPERDEDQLPSGTNLYGRSSHDSMFPDSATPAAQKAQVDDDDEETE